MPKEIQNLYDLFELPAFSSIEEVKDSYRKMALRYHPDRNPENPIESENYFKRINLAYQILSNLEKKLAYDQQLKKELTEEKMDHFHFTSSKVYQKRTHQEPVSKDDSLSDFKVGLALMAIVFGLIVLYSKYVSRQESSQYQKMKAQRFDKYFSKSKKLFDQHKFRQALIEFKDASYLLADSISASFAIRMEYNDIGLYYKSELEDIAINFEKNKIYDSAAICYSVLGEFFEEKRFDWQLKAITMLRYSHQSNEALEFLALIDKDQDPFISYVAAQIVHIDQQQAAKSLQFYDEAIRRVTADYTAVYGRAFMVVIKPEKVPQFHYDINLGRALARMELGNYQEALQDCNWCMFLRPQKPEAFWVRANILYKLGRNKEACQDFVKGKAKASPQELAFFENLCN